MLASLPSPPWNQAVSAPVASTTTSSRLPVPMISSVLVISIPSV